MKLFTVNYLVKNLQVCQKFLKSSMLERNDRNRLRLIMRVDDYFLMDLLKVIQYSLGQLLFVLPVK